MTPFQIEQQEQRGVVRLSGDLTAELVPQLQTALREALSAGMQEIRFDLSEVAMVDSSGLGLLIAASNSVSRTRGKIEVTNVSADIFRLLHSMRLVDRLNVHAPAREGVCHG